MPGISAMAILAIAVTGRTRYAWRAARRTLQWLGVTARWERCAGAQMGNNLPALNLGMGRTARHGGAGIRNSCIVLDDFTVTCWGQNVGNTPTTIDMTGLTLLVAV